MKFKKIKKNYFYAILYMVKVDVVIKVQGILEIFLRLAAKLVQD